MKVKNQKLINKNEFRKNKDSGHPNYIYAKVGNEYKFIGLTHSPITNNIKNIRLEKNPNPKDNRTAYFKPKAERGKVNRFNKKQIGWYFSKRDKQLIDKYKK